MKNNRDNNFSNAILSISEMICEFKGHKNIETNFFFCNKLSFHSFGLNFISILAIEMFFVFDKHVKMI